MPRKPQSDSLMKSGLASDAEKVSRFPSRIAPRRWLAVLALLVVVGLAAAGLGLGLLFFSPGPDLATQTQGIAILDRTNHQVALLKSDRTLMPVPLNKISMHLRQAILAAEDQHFYHHSGIDFFGLIRAVVVDAGSGRMVQGGSTITQQLVKNLFFEGKKRTFSIKVREVLMAIQLDRRYSKDDILEAYLNNVYYGSGTYGAEEAAGRYFGKSANALTLPESAYLAGLVNAPSVLSVNRKEAIAREQMILDNMARFKMITPAQLQAAKKVKLQIRSLPNSVDECSYYLIYVRKLLEDRVDLQLLYRKGVKAYTNLDVAAQRDASHSISSGILHAPKGVSQGALVSISVPDSAVIAMVGGAGSFQKSPWNRATSPHTAGSAFKPFVYLSGILTGAIKPDTMIDDAPLTVDMPNAASYSPKNFDGEYLGPITVRKALSLSRNTCAVRVGQTVGPQKVAEIAHAAGITSELAPTLALSLGASAVSPLDMANAYATLARGGMKMEPMFLRRVTKADGSIIENFQSKSDMMFEREAVAELVDILQDVVEKGTATKARLFGRQVAGKTGTADGARDIWFVGFTPDIVTAVWGGNDQNAPIAGRQVTGGTIMAGIWQNYMKTYYAQHPTPAGEFAPPATPFIEESEAVHFLPQPAGIFDSISQVLDPNDAAPRPAPQRELHRHDAENQQSDSKHKKGGIKKLFKKMFDWF